MELKTKTLKVKNKNTIINEKFTIFDNNKKKKQDFWILDLFLKLAITNCCNYLSEK